MRADGSLPAKPVPRGMARGGRLKKLGALNDVLMQVEAEFERRVRAGQWEGGVTAHTGYETRPLDWITDHLHVPRNTLAWSENPAYVSCACTGPICTGGHEHQWDGDPDPLVKAMQALAEWKNVGIEGATGCGKSYTAACIALWFLSVFENSLVVTVAPKQEQLLKQIWYEIGGLWKYFHLHFPHAELLSGQLRMRAEEEGEEHGWTAFAFVSGVGADEEVAQRAKGFHRRDMLFITEETPGIDPAIMNTLYNTRTDDHNLHLALGNPDHQHDELHRFCETSGVVHVRVSALDHPNIVTGSQLVAGSIGRKRLDERTERLGQGSRLYISHVRGISPPEAEDALIRWEWCEAAARRWSDPAYRVGEQALGVDVAASEDGDKGAIARWQGACLTEVVAVRCPDPNQLGRDVFREAQGDRDRPAIKSKRIAVDVVNVGSGTYNELRRLGVRVRPISSGTRAVPNVDQDILWEKAAADERGRVKPKGPVVVESERFDNLRSQIWWRMREDLRLGRIALPEDQELWHDLTAASYTTVNGKIVVESKEHIMKRLRRSPNKGDAAVYGNWVRDRSLAPQARAREELAAAAPKTPVRRDTRLERLLAEYERQRKAERRQMERFLRRFSAGGVVR